ncbi:MAG: right-handed parallel beta-helix repeat-containing protein, partial [Candidatus Pacearchaeota archaeon]
VGIQAYSAIGDVDNITIINSISSYNFGHGVLTTNSHNYLTNDNGFIQNVTSYGNGGSGIQISARTNNTIVRYSTAYGNGFAITEGTGIGSYNASNLLIEYSVSHSNYGNLSGSGAGFYFDVFNEGCVARYNIAYNNSKNGFIAEQGVGVKMYYNIAYNNSHGGFTLYGSDNRSGIHNNSIFNNVAVGNKYGIWVHGDYKLVNDSVTGNIIKNNIAVNNSEYQLFVENGGENDGILGKNNIYENNAFGKSYFGFILWGNASISNYMEFSLAYGNSTNSITTNPLFVDSGNNNFRLLQNSPGIDAGTNVGLIRDFSGNFVPQGRGVDVGAFEYLNISYDNFDGSTTNLSIIDTSNIPNLILEKTGKGKIHFNSPVNLSDGIDLNSRVIINSNHIEINSVISPQLNKSATLTLYNLPFDNPRVLMNDEVCPSNICSNINYNNGNLVFNVIGFSKYSAEETPTNFSGGRGSSGGGSSGSGAGIAGGVQNNNTFFSGSNQSGFNLTDNSTTVSSQENIKRSNTYFLYVLIIIILLFGIGSLSYIIWYISKKKL